MTSIITAPTVSYKCKILHKDDIKIIDNPLDAPSELIEYWEEAVVNATIITPTEYAKGIKSLCDEKRGYMTQEEYINQSKVVHLQYDIPLSELITDFFDRLKSVSSGYASLDYEHKKF